MTVLFLVGLSVLAVIAGFILFRGIPAVETYLSFRGKRIITCPETKKKAAVDVAARTAATTSLWGDPQLRLDMCSRWPERQACGQECLLQIEVDPENCLLWNIVSDWYQSQKCVFCHKPFTQLKHFDHAPALIGPDHKTAEWTQFRPEQIPEVLATYRAVCWGCHIAETFRRVHPELVVERDRDVHHTS